MLYRGIKSGFVHSSLEAKALSYTMEAKKNMDEFQKIKNKLATGRPAVKDNAAALLRKSLKEMETLDKIIIKMQNHYFGMVRRPGGIMLQPWLDLTNAKNEPLNCSVIPNYMTGIGKASFTSDIPQNPWNKTPYRSTNPSNRAYILETALMMEEYLVKMRKKMSSRVVFFINNMEVMKRNHDYIAGRNDGRRLSYVLQVDEYYTSANTFSWYYNDNIGIKADTREELLKRTGDYADKQMIVAESLEYENSAPVSFEANFWLNVMGEFNHAFRMNEHVSKGLSYQIRKAVSRRLPAMSAFDDNKKEALIYEYVPGVVMYNGHTPVSTHDVHNVKMHELAPRMRNRDVTVRVPQNRIHVAVKKVDGAVYKGGPWASTEWKIGQRYGDTQFRKLFPRRRPEIST